VVVSQVNCNVGFKTVTLNFLHSLNIKTHGIYCTYIA
jgi:hypothetical protein